MTFHTYDAVIIGGGAAGLSAAQTLGRSLRNTLVIDAGSPRNRFAAHMHNVLGHDGINPTELLARGREELERYGVAVAAGSVTAVRSEADSHLTIDIATEPGIPERSITTRALVVATGVRDVLPDIPGLAEHWGSGVFHCPYCHGWEVRDSRIGVVTTSPMSLHQVTLLRQWSDRVTVFSAGLGGLDPVTERALRARGMVIESDPVAEILGDGSSVTGVRTSSGSVHQIDAVFTVSGLEALDGFLADLDLDRTETPFGSFLTVDPMGRTSHPRIWAVGNVAAPMATVPVAMGAGAMAGGGVNFALVEEDFTLAVSAADAAETLA